jgi:hypothetical protein
VVCVGSQVRKRWVLAAPYAGCFRILSADQLAFLPALFVQERSNHHGELHLTVLDSIGLVLVAVLGFLPLMIVHLTAERPGGRMSHLNQVLLRLGIIKCSLLVLLTDWASRIVV